MTAITTVEHRSILDDIEHDIASRRRSTHMAIAGGAYEGASRRSAELMTWRTSSGSADVDILPEKQTVDERVRASVRNDGFISAALNSRMDNIVGSAYLLNSKPNSAVLGLDKTWEKEFQEEVEQKFTLWAESQSCWPDASRHNTLSEIVRLAIATEFMYGEFIATCPWIEDEPDRYYSTAVQIIDPDRLRTPFLGIPNSDNYTVGGIRKDSRGRAIGYYIRNRHPSDVFYNLTDADFTYVPATTDWGRMNVIHVFSQTRADQTRGISSMVSGLKELRIMRNFRDVVLQNAVVNATFAATIESDLDTAKLYEALGAGANTERFTEIVNKICGGYLTAAKEFTKDNSVAVLNGARIPHLLPGSKLHMQPAGSGGPLGSDFEASLLRYLAASLDISYEQLAHDYSKTNYSSARAAMNETQKSMSARKKFIADRVSTSIFHLWLEEAIAKKRISSMPANAPSYWEGLNKEAYGACDWIGASRGQIDELKETQAAVLRIKNGLSTREDEISRLGKDSRSVFDQLARENDIIKRLGLNFGDDSTDMMNAVSGTPRDRDPKDYPDDDPDANTNV